MQMNIKPNKAILTRKTFQMKKEVSLLAQIVQIITER